MGVVLKNNVATTLSSAISSTDTTLPVSDTSEFPTLGVGEYFYVTIESTTGAYEIVKVTQVNASSVVATRAQEDTIAIPFSAGARVELRVTVQALEDHFSATAGAVVDAAIASEIGVTVQAYDADLTTWAGLTPSANGQSLITAANYAAMRGLLDLEAGTDFYSITAADAAFQPKDADLTTWAGLTPSANAQSLVTAANYAAMRGLLDLEVGTDFYSIAAADAAAGALADAKVSDTVYGAGWNGDTTHAPSKNAVYDKIEAVAAGTLSDGDKGDITVSASGATWTIDNNAVTLAKMATMATDSILGRATAATGNVEVLTALPFAFTGDVTRAADSNATVLAAGSASVLNSGTLPAGRMPALTGEVTTSAGAVATTLGATAITARTEDTAPDPNADYVVTYDGSAAALKKVLLKNIKVQECITIAASDESTALTTGTGKVTWRMPYAFTVTAVRASLNTVSSSGTPTVDINEGAGAGTTILSTKLTIDANELTSTTAAVAAVISDTTLADDANMTIDIDTAGTGAKGLKVQIIGYRT